MEPPTEIKNLYTYINQPMQEMHAFYIFFLFHRDCFSHCNSSKDLAFKYIDLFNFILFSARCNFML